MVAFQNGSINDMSLLKWGTVTKLGVCPRLKPQAVLMNMMQLGEHRKSVKVRVNTFMYGQWPLPPACLVYYIAGN